MLLNINKKPIATFILSIVGCAGLASQVRADEISARADSHAPISVMGDHTHKAGEFMFSFRHMEMSMSGNLQGSEDISDEDIVTTIANRFAAMEGMPPTLRIVPQEMTTRMEMFGAMYAPSDRITLMAMMNYISKEMTLKTYLGMMGTNVRGQFKTSSEGLGDTKLGALVTLWHTPEHKIHLNLGLSLPTGEIDNRGGVLTPMAPADGEDTMMLMDMRLPYAMQLGSGTYDIEPGLTYFGMSERQSWGVQYKAVIRTGENDEGYTLGDQHQLQAWAQHAFSPSISSSLSLSARSLEAIDGMDSNIMGPVQTADPDNYGGDYLNAGIGINYYGQSGVLDGHRLAFEYSLPLQQDVNGVQMSMDNMFTLGYQYAF